MAPTAPIASTRSAAARRRGRRGRRPLALVGALACLATLPPGRVATATSASRPADRGALGRPVLAQIAAIEADKATRTPAEQKVDSNLLYAVRELHGGKAVGAAAALHSGVRSQAGGRVLVDVDAAVDARLLRRIDAQSGAVVRSVPRYRSIRALVRLDAVVGLAAQPEVRFVRPADEAVTSARVSRGNVGAGSNEADTVQSVGAARLQYGVDGTDEKVCVLSDGVDTRAARKLTGDLPDIQVLAGQAGSGDEGTAMLELIHDLAPGSPLGFATGLAGTASFAANVVALQAAGCRVIVDDVTYVGEPTFQDGPIAQAITKVRDAGAVYLTSAGNSGSGYAGTAGTWQGDFRPGSSSAAPLPPGMEVHNWDFTTAAVPTNALTRAGGVINLQWSDPLAASANDYDLFVLDPTASRVIASSTNVQHGFADPAETVGSQPAGSLLVVVRNAGAGPRYLVVYTNRGRLRWATGGAARGHNASPDALSVAATPAAARFGGGTPGPYPNPFSGSDTVETFSSDGPVRQYFAPNGAPYPPGDLTGSGGLRRAAPDLTAADGVTTTTPGFLRFYGTSAAAPDAAAIAALLFSRRPLTTSDMVRSAMKVGTVDIGPRGYDEVSGAGIVTAPLALAEIDRHH